jgi:Rod binding domain-containing protein
MLSHPNAITAGSPGYSAALMKEAKKLEGVFLNTLTSEMFSSIKTDGEFGGGFGEQTWRSMQAEQLANQISESGGIGLAENITRSLLDAQAAATAVPQVNMQGAYPQ